MHDAATLEAFLASALRTSAALDGVGLVCAMRAVAAGGLDALAEVDAEIHARKLARIRAGTTPGTHPASLAPTAAAIGARPAEASRRCTMASPRRSSGRRCG